MRYEWLYGSTYTLEEVAFRLFRTPAPTKCWGCGAVTSFITYAWRDRPVPVCSTECFERVDAVAKLPAPPR